MIDGIAQNIDNELKSTRELGAMTTMVNAL